MTDPDQLTEPIRSAMGTSMTAYAGELTDTLRESLGTPYPPASAPGEKPHRRSGLLQGSAANSVTGSRAEVWTDVPYGAFLEEGTSKMSARPHVAPLAEKTEAEIADRLIELFVENF